MKKSEQRAMLIGAGIFAAGALFAFAIGGRRNAASQSQRDQRGQRHPDRAEARQDLPGQEAAATAARELSSYTWEELEGLAKAGLRTGNVEIDDLIIARINAPEKPPTPDGNTYRPGEGEGAGAGRQPWIENR